MGFTVAIDGPAAAGKGTLARALAAHFGFGYLDTGLLYRAVGARVADGQDPVVAAHSLTEVDFQRDDLRTVEMGGWASQVWPPSPRCAKHCLSISAILPHGPKGLFWMGAILELSFAQMRM